MSTDTKDNEPFNRVSDLLKLRLDHIGRYHDHKETMAHAALLVALAMAGFVVTAANWPPTWLPKWVAAVGLAVGWFLIHRYMHWQLGKRRAAAQLEACLHKTLQRWAVDPPSENEELQPTTESVRRPSPRCLWLVIDFVCPLKLVTVGLDDEEKAYPRAVVAELTQTPVTDAITAERLVSLASILLLVLVLVRTLHGP